MERRRDEIRGKRYEGREVLSNTAGPTPYTHIEYVSNYKNTLSIFSLKILHKCL